MERGSLYKLTALVVRSFANCSDRLESHYGYTVKKVDGIRREIHEYSRIKNLVMLASGDYIDLKAYDADMRYILDTYIHAEESNIISALSNMSLVELLADGEDFTPDEVLRKMNCDDTAKPEIIENNITFEIAQRMNTNAIYYGKLSEMLKALITRRKNEAIDYAEYLALKVDGAIWASKESGFRENLQKARRICASIYRALMESGMDKGRAESETTEIFEIVKAQPEYDG